jgi:hypothetical protein
MSFLCTAHVSAADYWRHIAYHMLILPRAPQIFVLFAKFMYELIQYIVFIAEMLRVFIALPLLSAKTFDVMSYFDVA